MKDSVGFFIDLIRFYILLSICSLVTQISFGQSKTLGIGTSAPNTNAALHVESPANNQGILIPRLNTSQRNSLGSSLTSVDVGLLLFDTDLRALAIWNGTSWDIGSKAGAPISINNNTATGNAAALINSNFSNVSPTLTVDTNGSGNAIQTTGKIQAGQFIGDGSLLTNLPLVSFPLTSTLANALPLMVLTNSGTGSAGQFLTTNPATSSDALIASSNATSGLSAIHGTHSAGAVYTDAAIKGESNGAASGITGIANGTGAAGYFNTFNNSSTTPTMRVVSNGLGQAAQFQIFQATNSSNVINVTTLGTGSAGSFVINNSASNGASLIAQTSGLGNAVTLLSTNVSNTSPAIDITHSGTGNAITANRPIQATSFIGDGSALTGIVSFPAGIILPFAGGSTPSGYLLCDGAAISRTTYAALFSALGTSWGAGDGSTTFNLPDLRGRFLRGVDGSAGNDPDAGARTALLSGGATGNNVGSYQSDDFKSHTHDLSPENSAALNNGPGLQRDAVGTDSPITITTGASGGSETRPKNAYINFIIKM